jgi:hypothetical protein
MLFKTSFFHKIAVLFIFLLLNINNLFSQEISNIHFELRDKLIYIYYDLIDGSKKATYDVKIFYCDNGGNKFKGPLKHVTGSVGKGISAGKGKLIVWNVLNENDNLIGEIKFSITANPHYIKTPNIKAPKSKSYSKKKYKSNNMEFSLGPSFSANMTGISSATEDYFSGLIFGYNAGMAFNFSFLNDFSIQPELLYEKTGCKLDELSSSEENKLIHTYIKLPLLFQGHTPFDDGEAIFLGGPYIGYLINTQYANQTSFFDPSTQSNTSYIDFFQNFDYGFTIGIDLAPSKKVLISIRYNHGLYNTLKDSNSSSNYIHLEKAINASGSMGLYFLF